MIENSESVFGIKMLQKKEKRPQAKPGGQYDSFIMHDHETADQASDKKSQRKRNSHSI